MHEKALDDIEMITPELVRGDGVPFVE